MEEHSSIVFPLEFKELMRLKKEIDKNPEKWEEVKRVINPLEFASCDIAVAKVQPISRAFFKMIELSEKLNPLPETPVRTLHLAEAPGGFVQAWNWIRKPFGLTDEMTAISLEKTSFDITWKRLLEVSRFWFSRPTLQIGDLMKKETRDTIIEEYTNEKIKAWLITGDGGFDFSEDYQNQETKALPLILSQMLIGLRCLDKGGCMILKIFDCFTLPTIQILWVFCKVFGEFRIVKPDTSRVCNAEKYIIAKDFKGVDKNLDIFLTKIDGIINEYEKDASFHIETLFDTGPISKWDTIDEHFKMSFELSIKRFINTQINWIQKGIDMMNSDKIIENTKIKTANVVKWCRKYHIPINREYFESHRLCHVNRSEEASSLSYHSLRQSQSQSQNHRIFYQKPVLKSDQQEPTPPAFLLRHRSFDDS